MKNSTILNGNSRSSTKILRCKDLLLTFEQNCKMILIYEKRSSISINSRQTYIQRFHVFVSLHIRDTHCNLDPRDSVHRTPWSCLSRSTRSWRSTWAPSLRVSKIQFAKFRIQAMFSRHEHARDPLEFRSPSWTIQLELLDVAKPLQGRRSSVEHRVHSPI